MIGCNFDVFIAGCSTNCRHCYVDGGPRKATSIDNLRYLMDRLETLLPKIQNLGLNVSVTLDNEPANHQDAIEIYQLTKAKIGSYFFNHGSTTGIPLLNHKHRGDLTKMLLQYGYEEVGLTVHGGHDNHNKMVNHPLGLSCLIEASEYYNKHKFKIVISLMLSQLLVRDRDEITDILKLMPHQGMYFAITDVSPIERMQAYHEYRATLDDVKLLKGYLSEWELDEEQIMTRLETCHENHYIDTLKKISSWNEVKGSESYIFMSVDHELNLFYGNTGLEIENLGNLKLLTDEDVIEAMRNIKPNDCYWDSFFNTETLPSINDFLEIVDKQKTKNYIYPNMDSFLTYWFKKLMF